MMIRRPPRGWRLDPRTRMLVPTCLRMGAAGGGGGEAGGSYATWNPDDKSTRWDLSNGDLTASKNQAGNAIVRSTVGVASGKWYWEVHLDTNSNPIAQAFGIATIDQVLSAGILGGSSGDSWAYYGNGVKKYGGSTTSWGTGTTEGDTCMVALNMDSGKIWFGEGGTWFESGNPAAGTGEAFSGIAETVYAAIYDSTSDAVQTANFGASSFAYSPPSGFTGLSE
jgi:hypothetical protein